MEPAAIRHKNPGAMWPGTIATKWGSTRWVYLSDGTGQGGNGKGNKIATFDNWVDGICAQLDLWRTSKHYKNKRFADAIRTWSGGNNVPAYIRYVKARIPGMDEDTIMDDTFWKGPMGLKFLQVQAGHEAGKPIPAPQADWVEAQRRVFANQPPKPRPKPADALIPVVVSSTAGTTAHTAGFPLWAVIAIGIGAFAAFIAVKTFLKYRELKKLDAEIETLQKAIPNEQVQELNGELPPEGAVLRGDDSGQDGGRVHPEGA
jgi:hypothetical protein